VTSITLPEAALLALSERVRALGATAGELLDGGSLHEVLDRVVARADGAVQAAGHVLAVQLPDGTRHVKTRGIGAGIIDALRGGVTFEDVARTLAELPFLAVSFECSSGAFGTLAAVARPGHDFLAGDQAAFDAYVKHAAASIEMSLLLEQARVERETAEMLLDVSQSLSDHATIDAVAQALSDAVLPLTGSHRSAVAVWDPVSRQIRLAGLSGWHGALAELATAFVTTPEECPELSDIVAHGRPLLFDRRGSDWARNVLDEFDLDGVATVPIKADGTFIGLVCAYWTEAAPRVLDDALTHRMSGLAGLASVAFQKTQLMERVRWHAFHDSLTALPNRGFFDEQLQNALKQARGTGQRVGLLFCDINRFKRVNDSLGHRAGDELLRQFSVRMRSVIRSTDIMARLSGDEFAVMMDGFHDASEIELVAARIREALRRPFRINGETLFIDAAIGIALSDGSDAGTLGDSAHRLVELAGLRMHESKSITRGPALERASRPELLRLETSLHGAAGRHELRVAYQPQIDLTSNQVVAVEALVRWQHPDFGLLQPGDFIPLAEESGLIREVGAYVLAEACRTGAAWHSAGFPIEVAVNVSVVQLNDLDFPSLLQHALRESGFPATSLTVEITESQVVTDHAAIGRRLQELRRAGIGVSIDDFGTGYSSLAQLQRLPVTEIKIDRTFTAELSSAGTSPLVAGIIGLGRGLGHRVVAEGVETAEQLETLRAEGCARAQGYFIGRPCEAGSILQRLRAEES
jgi:diguanylate cyclase (GGDEF)-like protein